MTTSSDPLEPPAVPQRCSTMSQYISQLRLRWGKPFATWSFVGDVGCFNGKFFRERHQRCFSRWWFQTFFMFTPIWGNHPILTNIFQMGWNHRPVLILDFFLLMNLHLLYWNCKDESPVNLFGSCWSRCDHGIHFSTTIVVEFCCFLLKLLEQIRIKERVQIDR